MPAILDDRHVDVDDVAVLEGLAVIGNAVTDHVVHGGADGFRERNPARRAAIAQTGGDSMLLVDDMVVTDAVQFLGGDPRLDVLADHFQDFGGQFARFAHFGDLFGGFDDYIHDT